jgi:hypothetical protein
MGSFADDLPSRFPVGTRYVVEGRGGGRGRLRIRLRYLEFPDGRHIQLPVDLGHRTARTAAVRPGGPRPENNFAPRNCGPACAFNGQRRVECPQPPTPHPSGERPWPALGAGVFLYGPLCAIGSESWPHRLR